MSATSTSTGGGATAEDQLEQVRARIRAAGGAAEQARRSTAAAVRLEADAELLRRRLPVAGSAADQARRAARSVRGLRPAALWFGVRGRLAVERARRSAELQAAQAERWVLADRITEQETQAEALRAEALRLRTVAATLPRLLDQAAACVRQHGGPHAEALAAAEGGLEPVLRRESDLDQAVRWAQWAQLQVGSALDRLGPARPGAGGSYAHYLDGDPAGDPEDEPDVPPAGRAAAARAALAGVRDVLDVLRRALADLGAGMDGVTLPELPLDLGAWFEPLLIDPQGPARDRVIAALTASEQAALQLAGLRIRLTADHAATRRVLDERRAQWCRILRGV